MELSSDLMEVLILFMSSFLQTSAVTHSLQYIYTAVTPGINFPEFTIVGQVDGQQFNYYDSKIRSMIPKTEWILKNDAEDPEYWNRNTQIAHGSQEVFKVNVGTLMGRFNQTKGVHTLQLMYGCELDDDGTTRGYTQYGYDGEDFIVFDLKTLTWIAPTPQALITKNKWDFNPGHNNNWRNYLENTCNEWLKKYVSYGKELLERKVRPEVSVFQKHSPSPEVVCHATGFFPKAVMITWQKDGEDLYEDVELSETLPNQDGSFQKRSILKVPAEELQKHTYTCVVQHSSLEKELVREVPKGTHSLQYIYTAVTPGINFPEFTIVGQVDGQQFNYYDSKIRSMIPKTEWIEKLVGENYWSSETQISQGTEETFKVNVGVLMQRFNQTKGVHTAQLMYGCELDDDGTTRGYTQYGYNGEDFISFDLKTLTWIAPTPQALITKNKWDPNTGFIKGMENYLKNICIKWLKKYLSYGKETLERKVRPKVSLFQKHSPSSEVVCHATSFFPKTVMITWQKDGEDVHEDVELRETLPNQDGSFQKRSILKVPAEELQKHNYTCVVQHSSLEKELVREVPKGPNKLAL
ncbi:uncharacterized protein Hap1MRO34_023403 [Clarias gariepinus]|uniref:patr class I histocompatibility antigen, A-5 alpha chain-like n=1 Tax=Clarias gariepinus TaxID=13013 RepID=UPI00234DB69B|nr:patr class I histocompatibility antigen, A-5 alpha chain-like [Clarias gariepinus]